MAFTHPSIPQFCSHLFQVKYLGPTDFLGSRVSIKSQRFPLDKAHRVSYGDHPEDNSALDVALRELVSLGYAITAFGETKGGYWIASSTFLPIGEAWELRAWINEGKAPRWYTPGFVIRHHLQKILDRLEALKAEA